MNSTTTPAHRSATANTERRAPALWDRTLTLWVHTEDLWRDLEAAAGQPRFSLGRFKEWAALAPAHFSADQYDLDAMVAWARANGIPYTDETSLHYSGTTGVVDRATERLTLSPTPIHTH